MEKQMHCIDMSLEERLLSMQQCLLSKLDIISDKLDAVVAAMSYCDISNRPTPSGLLATSEDIHERQAPCVPTLHEKVTLDLTLGSNSRFYLVLIS